MKKRKIIVIVFAALLVAGLGVFFLTRDSGPPPAVYGNFSPRDVAQIQAAVRHRLWREVLPDFSRQSLKAFPSQVKRAFTTRVGYIRDAGPAAGYSRRAYAVFAAPPGAWPDGYVLANGPSGWRWQEHYFYIVPD